MNEPRESPDGTVRLIVSDPVLVAPVLERLVSAAAVQAELPVDRLVNALAAVDALTSAAARTLAAVESLEFSLTIEPRRIELSVESLTDGEAESLLAATRLPDIGAVLERFSESVTTESVDDVSALKIALA